MGRPTSPWAAPARSCRGSSASSTKWGGTLRLNARVKNLLVENGTATGVRLDTDEEIPADIVVSNADVAHFYKSAVPAPRPQKVDRRAP